MLAYYKRISFLIVGLWLFALGSVLTMKANIGYTPWNCFHQGLSNYLHISIGTAANTTGCLIFLLVCIFRERIGIGTIGNMLAVGWIMDILLWTDVIPLMHTPVAKGSMFVFGMMVIAVGSYYYMSSAFGAGPRDSLLVILSRKMKVKVGYCSIIIEGMAALTGFFMGGSLGIGTIFGALGQGLCIHLVFSCKQYDPVQTVHESLTDSVNKIYQKIIRSL